MTKTVLLRGLGRPPLPCRWSRLVANGDRSLYRPGPAPLPIDEGAPAEGVVVRCGDRIARLRGRDGRVLWSRQLLPGSHLGEVLLRAGDLAITNAAHPSTKAHQLKNASDLTAVRLDDGSIAWSRFVQGSLRSELIALDGELLRIQVERSKGRYLVEIDTRTGRAVREGVVEHFFRDVVRTPAGLVGARGGGRLPAQVKRARAGLAGAPGTGRRPTRVSRSPQGGPISIVGAWWLRRAGDAVVTLAHEVNETESTVEVRDARTLRVRWSAVVTGLAGDADESGVVAQEGEHVVLRSIGDGAVIWKRSWATLPVTRLDLAGPYVVAGPLFDTKLLSRLDGRALGPFPSTSTLLVTKSTAYVTSEWRAEAWEPTAAPRARSTRKAAKPVPASAATRRRPRSREKD